MARTHLTTCKSTGHQPTGQLGPQGVPLPQEPQHDSPPCASQEEEPFEIELVVPGSPIAQGAPAEEQQQLEDHEGEKLYRDADERE
jgi:hypothetical protein